VTDTTRFDVLRLQYRMKWDVCQIVSHRNTLIRNGGRQPSDQQIVDEKQATAAVDQARDALLGAIARLGGG